jgi:hypothetical protein
MELGRGDCNSSFPLVLAASEEEKENGAAYDSSLRRCACLAGRSRLPCCGGMLYGASSFSCERYSDFFSFSFFYYSSSGELLIFKTPRIVVSK